MSDLEPIELAGGVLFVAHATVNISSRAIPDSDYEGDESAQCFDDFRMTLHGRDDLNDPKAVTLVFKSTDVENFAGLLESAAKFYRMHHPRRRLEGSVR